MDQCDGFSILHPPSSSSSRPPSRLRGCISRLARGSDSASQSAQLRWLSDFRGETACFQRVLHLPEPASRVFTMRPAEPRETHGASQPSQETPGPTRKFIQRMSFTEPFMMRLRSGGWRVVLGMLAGFALAGCAAPPDAKPKTPAIANSGQVARIRAQYQKLDPNSRVGVVIAVRPQDRLAAVGEIPTRDFKPGDVLSFEDVNQNIVTVGSVKDITPNFLVVEYAPPPQGG